MEDNRLQKTKTLVLGVGNEILSDDGIGPKIVNRLKEELPHSNVSYENICLGGLEIMEFIRGYQNVIIIDAIKTESGNPGDVYLLSPEHFKETHHLSNFHDVSFLTGLRMSKKLGLEVPEVILIVAVEIVEDTLFSESFSPEIEAKYEQIYGEIFSLLEPALYGDQSINQFRNLITSV